MKYNQTWTNQNWNYYISLRQNIFLWSDFVYKPVSKPLAKFESKCLGAQVWIHKVTIVSWVDHETNTGNTGQTDVHERPNTKAKSTFVCLIFHRQIFFQLDWGTRTFELLHHSNYFEQWADRCVFMNGKKRNEKKMFVLSHIL